jgi:hypothetical protein
MKMKIRSVLLVMTFVCAAALVPKTQAVVPAPDGGYPGGNTAEGQNALLSLTSGGYNTALGYFSVRSDTTGSFNTGVGAGALFSATGDQNTAIGAVAGLNLTTGHNNICMGSGVVGVAGENNTIRIGDNLPSQPGSSACYIGGIWGSVVTGGATPVFIDSSGHLGTTYPTVGTASSSRRFYRDVKPLDSATEALFALKPVTFRYKTEIDPKGTSQLGLVAEEVEKINPDLVVRDKDGKPYAVRYEQVNAMLLNEFLKEHGKVEKLEATVTKQEVAAAKQDAKIARQQKQIEILTTGLQKVSAQLELSKPAPQTVLKNQ